MPGAGFEPALPCGKRLLRPLCLPFHHPGGVSKCDVGTLFRQEKYSGAFVQFVLRSAKVKSEKRYPMRHVLGSAMIGCMFVVFGCGPKDRARNELAVRILRNGDARFAARSDLVDLDRAIQWYLSGAREFPTEPKLLGRLARAYTVRAYAHPDDGLDGFVTAREFGLRCLMLEDAFGGLVQSAGGAVTKRAVGTLEPNRIGCITWTSLAWSRWLDERGVVGASIDLGATQALAEKAVSLNGQYDGGRPYAALGLALALPPEPLGPDLEGARKAFAEASRLSPDRLTPVVDLAQYVSAAEGKQAEWEALLGRVVETTLAQDASDGLENSAAIQRARSLLEAGIDSRWKE
jgi:hypothetical protein